MALTTEDRAKALGLKSYDFAIPLDWVLAIEIKLSKIIKVSGNLVWCYDPKDDCLNFVGYPVAVTREGRELLGEIALQR